MILSFKNIIDNITCLHQYIKLNKQFCLSLNLKLRIYICLSELVHTN